MRYIEREAAIAPLRRWQKTLAKTYGKNDEYVKCLDDVIDKLIDIPNANVAPVAHGEWIEYGEPNQFGEYHKWYWTCSVCNEVGLDSMNFCPNCGAQMDVPDTDVGEMGDERWKN